MPSIPIGVANFFSAMQAGRAAEAEMRQLFAADAVYIEPFSGNPQRHVGRDAIMRAMSAGWQQPLTDMRIVIDSAEVKGIEVHIRWTCYSPSLPGGLGRGLNRFIIQNGLISELETTFE